MNVNKTRKAAIAYSIKDLPEPLRKSVLAMQQYNGTPGVLHKFMLESLATPHGTKANCYAHFLGLRSGLNSQGDMVHGGLTDRNHKSQPGESCSKQTAKSPLEFSDRNKASFQIIDRVICDNPNKIFFLKPPYTDKTLIMKLPRGFHMGCGIVGGQDYHFLRREGINVILKSKLFFPILSSNVKEQLIKAKKNGHQYVWSHIAGWSGRMKLVDARGKIILNPVPIKANGPNTSQMTFQNKADHHYPSLDYDTFVGFFIIKSRSASVSTKSGMPVDIREMKARLQQLGVPASLVNARLPRKMQSVLKH